MLCLGLLFLLSAYCSNATQQNINDKSNDYAGFRIPFEGWQCDVISPPTSPVEFYENYILQRKPVIIRMNSTGLKKLGWQVPEMWTDDFLSNIAGEDVVQQTVRKSYKHMSSRQQQSILFKEYIQNKNSKMYLTQFQKHLVSGRVVGSTILIPPFLKKFVGYFNIPFWISAQIQSVNLWLGWTNHVNISFSSSSSSQSPQSTFISTSTMTNGHFDDVDNVIVMLDGVKNFRIWDPSSAFGLYTWAPIQKIDKWGNMILGEPPNTEIPTDDRYLSPYRAQGPRTIHAPSLKTKFSTFTFDDRKVTDLQELKKIYPRFYENTTIAGECEMKRGDILYLPGCFIHEVESVGSFDKQDDSRTSDDIKSKKSYTVHTSGNHHHPNNGMQSIHKKFLKDLKALHGTHKTNLSFNWENAVVSSFQKGN